MILQDPAGALNPRHTVYDSVAEGLRLHRLSGDDPDGRSEEQQVADALAVGRAAAARSGCSCATRTSCPAASASGC